ncbi:MAG TPA: tripartite tricarboxylate transporter permease [Ramlibacter sp.]|nr:tripartite tricarboxylate transporter permease [Ramlibacter sp.]
MELLSHLALGFETALSLQNLFYAFVGCLLGTLIGVLPGLGPSTTIAMLPITYSLQPVAALIMLAGIYYGSQYGGSIGVWVKLLKVPCRFLYPAILVFCCIGVYSINNNVFDVFMTAGFGLVGYVFSRCGMEPAPLLLGFVLGPMMEENLRRALLLSRGDFSTLVTCPLSLGLLIATLALLLVVALPAIRKTREDAFQAA